MEQDFARVTEYLPNLPKPRLDDRTFEELVEECLLRIPRYCPEWTNHNAGDPGITLIELFSWLVHQMLHRFNQVPLLHYIAFLELLGVRLQPPASASTNLTFYLTKAQNKAMLIKAGTEVATVRTENQEAEVFTTDRDLVVGQAQLKHFLFGEFDSTAQGLANSFDREINLQDWENTKTSQSGASTGASTKATINLFEPCRPGRCFYFVLEPAQDVGAVESGEEALANSLEGNVLAINFKGSAAVTTGIDPNNPPLKWQAWNGHEWCDGILRPATGGVSPLQTTDDRTKGFSFDRLGDAGPNPEVEGADVVLHMPLKWPSHRSGNYEGHWIRCLYIHPAEEDQQFGYERSPQINDVQLRTIGVMGPASECIQIGEELLGVSNGKAGQTFDLAHSPILARKATERIEIRLPNRPPEPWEEVSDFGASKVNSPHYLIDNSGGTVQFGPLVREPEQLKQQTRDRSQNQAWNHPSRLQQSVDVATSEAPLQAVLEASDRYAEKQYGKVPPLGAEIYITGYRVGGGSRGNVQAEKLTVMKSSLSYVKAVTNYVAAEGGAEKESLNEAIIRVPVLLRTRETALTPEEFEYTAAKKFEAGQAVHRAHCMTAPHLTTPGVVRLLIVPCLPKADMLNLPKWGLHPNKFLNLDRSFKSALDDHLKLHKVLGIRVTTEPPACIGVQVRAEVYPHTQYQRPDELAHIDRQLRARLYEFLNPITGGVDKAGWPLGQSVQVSDVVALLQGSPHVRSVGQVELFRWQPYQHRTEQGWELQWMCAPAEPLTKIDLEELTMLTSWSDRQSAEPLPTEDGSQRQRDLDPGHEIFFL